MYYVYILQSKINKKTFYTGYTADLKRRVQEHFSGRSTYTHGNEWQLVYYEAYMYKHQATQREAALKQYGVVYQNLIKKITTV